MRGRGLKIPGALIAVFAALAGGCAGDGEHPPSPGPAAGQQPRRLDAPYAPTIVVPAAALGLPEGKPSFRVRLDDGRTVQGRIARIVAAPAQDRVAPPGWREGWLPGLGSWNKRGLDLPPPADPSVAWVDLAIIDIPLDAAGQGLWIGESRLAFNWLPSPESAAAQTPGVAWTSPLGDLALRPEIRAAALTEARNPFRRWRARLVLGTLAPDAAEDPAALFAEPELELLARQSEDRWRVALVWLHAADAQLAARVRARLTRVIDFGPSVAPAWPVNQEDLDGLLADLLDPALSPARRAARARLWLESQPTAVGWVVSDAAGISARSGAPVAMLKAANLSETDLPASAVILGAVEPPELSVCRSAAVASLSVALPDAPPAADSMSVDLRVGAWVGRPRIIAAAVPVRPPALVLAPLAADWSLSAWLSDRPKLLAVDRAAGPFAQLERELSPTPHLRRIQEGWSLRVTLPPPPATPPSAAPAPDLRSITLWIGLPGRPASAVRLQPAAVAGPAIVVQPSGPPTAATAEMFIDDRGVLIARLRIPPEEIPGRSVAIGLTYTDPQGANWSWPRPMMPWDKEPGRVLIDLAAWSGMPIRDQ